MPGGSLAGMVMHARTGLCLCRLRTYGYGRRQGTYGGAALCMRCRYDTRGWHWHWHWQAANGNQLLAIMLGNRSTGNRVDTFEMGFTGYTLFDRINILPTNADNLIVHHGSVNIYGQLRNTFADTLHAPAVPTNVDKR